MNKKTVNQIIGTIIVLLITFINISTLVNVVYGDYDEIDKQDTSTSIKEVELDFVMKNSKHEITEKIRNDSSIYLKINLKDIGYIDNTEVLFNNPNFVIKDNIKENKLVKSIEEGKITLNTITESTVIEIPIKYESSDYIKNNDLNRDTYISVNGKYANKKKWTATKRIKVNWTEDIEAEIQQDFERYIEKDGKTIVETSIKTRIKDNKLPVKMTRIKANIIQIDGNKPDEIKVISNSKATNGKQLGLQISNILYDKENNVIEFSEQNNEDNNISWIKNSYDNYKIIYVYNKEFGKDELTAELTGTVYIDTINNINVNRTDKISKQLKRSDNLINANIYSSKSINKGYLYLNNDTKNTNYNTYYDLEIIDTREQEIEINDIKEKIIGEGIELDTYNSAYYMESKINGNQLRNILGENGKIEFYNDNNEKLIELTSNTKTDDKGDVIINYEQLYMQKLHIKIKNPESVGNILLKNTKQIRNNENINTNIIDMEKEIQGIVEIKSKSSKEQKGYNIKLDDTITKINCTINQNKLSNTGENEIVITAKLLEHNNKYRLFKNPKLRIEMPPPISEVTLGNIILLYNEEFTINSTNIYESENGNKVIEIGLEGSSSKYKTSKSNTAINIPMKIKLKDDISTTKENIKIQYENENTNKNEYYIQGRQYDEIEINTIAKEGIVKIFSLTNKTTNQTVKTYDDQTKYLDFNINGNEQIANVNTTIINNYDNSIYDVNIIGKISNNSEEENNLNTFIKENILKNNIDADIYYSEDINAGIYSSWSKEVKDYSKIKSYKIAIKNEMKHGDRLDLNYNLAIPNNINFNMKGVLTYSILYKYNEKSYEEKQTLGIMTPQISTQLNSKGTDSNMSLKMNISGMVGTKELTDGDTLHADEIIKYKVEVKNETNIAISNIETELQVPENTVYVTINDPQRITKVDGKDENGNINFTQIDLGRYEEHEDIRKLTNKIQEIKPGESVIKEYELKIKSLDSNEISNISSNFIMKINGQEESKYTINNKISNSDIKADLEFYRVEGSAENDKYDYYYNITNLTDHDLENSITEIYLPEQLNIYEQNILLSGIEYGKDGYDKNSVIEKNGNTIILKTNKIEAKATVRIELRTQICNLKDKNTEINVAGKTIFNEEEYQSNIITKRVETANITLTKSSEQEGQDLKADDIISYTIIAKNESDSIDVKTEIRDFLPKELMGMTVKFNKIIAEEVITEDSDEIIYTEQEYEENLKSLYMGDTDKEDLKGICEYDAESNIVVIPTYIPRGKTINIQIEARAENITETKDIINKANITGDFVLETSSNEVRNKVIKENNNNSNNNDDNDDDNDDDNNGNDGNDGNEDNDNNNDNMNSISGFAWLDKNEDGIKEEEEELLDNVTVKIIDSNTGEFVKNDNGDDIEEVVDAESGYKLNNLPNGKYVVIFEYDNDEYSITKYRATSDGKSNSNAIEVTLDGEVVGSTEILNIYNSDMSNINIGLIKENNMDVVFKKYIDSVVVAENGKYKTYNIDKQLGKVELDGKKINNSSIIVKYRFNIKNNGNKSIKISDLRDNLPNGLEFNSTINENWYEDDDEIIYEEIEQLEAGEEKSIELVLTKNMTENNTGTVSNNASIEITNWTGTESLEFEDEANLIIGIKTGKIVICITLIMSMTILTGIGVYLIKRKNL